MGLSQQYKDYDHRVMAQESKLAAHPAVTIKETKAEDKYKILEERMGVIEGFNIFGVDVVGMCLVPNMVIPPKFKTLEFEHEC